MNKKKRIIVTGANGQLGNAIRRWAPSFPDWEFLPTDVDRLDICDAEAVRSYVREAGAGYLVNCAAYTAVDKAEEFPELCMRLNADAVRNLGEAAQETGVKVIHLSTDYVFDGRSYRPYVETDPTHPLSVYGKTKLAGEQALRASCPDSVILRTAWLYSEFGNNFVKTMLRLGTEKEQLNVLFDQIGTPTYAVDLAKAILDVISGERFIPGIYHYSNEGVCSWYDFAVRIFAHAGLSCRVMPIETKDYPAKAPRPSYSVLNKGKIKQTYGVRIPHWEESLCRCLEEIKKNQ